MEAILLTWRVRADYIYDTLLTTSNGLKWLYEFGSKPASLWHPGLTKMSADIYITMHKQPPVAPDWSFQEYL